MRLYRPVGLKELKLIAASGYRAFPPRLPEQPIFYPVVTLEYAVQIARDWNAKATPFAGFVTSFDVEDDFVRHYEVKTVGAREHQELWVPAEELDAFNRHITGRIEVVAQFYGEGFAGKVDPMTNLPIFHSTD
jgi:hypothetical protein